jgi:hypothetical protein
MTAAEASDESGTVEYYFQCTTDGHYNSGWLSFAPGQPCTYTVQVGRSGQVHRFRVKARDLYGNETGWSSTLPTHP